MLGYRKLLIGLTLILMGCSQETCVKSHVEHVHHDAWESIVPIMAGKVPIMVPIHHPEEDYDAQVCDEYKEQ